MFDGVKVLRSPAFNVATWNLSTRRATGSLEQGIQINGEELGFYHFSGFDSGAQERQLKEYGSHSPVLFELRDWYIRECERHGQEELGKLPCKYNFYEDGTVISDGERVLYRERADLQRTFPDPFATSGYIKSDLVGGYAAWYGAHGDDSNNSADILTVKPNVSIRDFLCSSAAYLDKRATEAVRTGMLKRSALRTLASFMRGVARFASSA